MFWKECKKVGRGVSYLLFVLVIVLVFFTQDVFYTVTSEPPKPGQESYSEYGFVITGDEETIMDASVQNLIYEFTNNRFITYPFGFYKEVRLKEEERKEVAQWISEIVEGYSKEDILNLSPQEHTSGEILPIPKEDGTFDLVPADELSSDIITISPKKIPYSSFQSTMSKINDLLGGGSSYSEDHLLDFSRRPANYEEALEEFQQFKSYDKYSGGHARLFADYISIFATIVPVFIAISESMRDRNAKMQHLLWTRSVSSVKFIFSRYFSIVFLCMIPILLLALGSTFYTAFLYSGKAIDYLAFFKYSFGWILPGILISTAVGTLFTEATDTPLAIIPMGIWWFLDLGMGNLVGNYIANPFVLMPRHNSITSATTYLQGYSNLVQNRLFYSSLALAFVCISAWILSRKRTGRWFSYDNIRKNIRTGKKKWES